jgi:phosphatidylethanolamine/phosphatidyl-N-methylethanolamine N-methyltransferase
LFPILSLSKDLMSDTLRFIGHLIRQPKRVGAVAPSSKALGRAIAAQIDIGGEGKILELGPGTGIATAALIARGVAAERIVAVEYDPDFARLIAKRFPRVTVIRGDAFDLEKTLDARFIEPFSGAVSGVPLLNYSMERRQAYLEDLLKRLKRGAPCVQFSYGLNPPVAPPAGVTVVLGAFVLFNLPPARVWVYRRQ